MTRPTLVPANAFGRVLQRCTGCGYTYGVPTTHVPDSEDCREAARTHAESRAD